MSSESEKVTRHDLERSLRALQQDLTGVTEEKKSLVVAGGVASGVVALLAAYFLGRRKGRRSRNRIDR
jgi:NH3-dependent NAD+ synthetase